RAGDENRRRRPPPEPGPSPATLVGSRRAVPLTSRRRRPRRSLPEMSRSFFDDRRNLLVDLHLELPKAAVVGFARHRAWPAAQIVPFLHVDRYYHIQGRFAFVADCDLAPDG